MLKDDFIELNPEIISEIKPLFMNNLLKNIHPAVKSWFTETELERNINKELDKNVESLFDDYLAEKFWQYAQITDTNAEDYKTKLIKLGDLVIMVGIRFKGGNLNKPFINLIYSTQDINNQLIDEIADRLRLIYTKFNPKALRIYYCASAGYLSKSQTAKSLNKLDKDLGYFAGSLKEIRSLPKPSHYDRMVLQLATNLDFYDQYLQIYKELHEENPWTKEEIYHESREALQDSLENGLLFNVFIDNQWVGIITSYLDTAVGMYGYCVLEFALRKEWRGKGFGSVLQRHFAEVLDEKQTDVIFGTIAAKNLPSRYAVQRAGRIEIGSFYWFNY